MLFVLLAIVLSILLRYTVSDWPFGIFKLFLFWLVMLWWCVIYFVLIGYVLLMCCLLYFDWLCCVDVLFTLFWLDMLCRCAVYFVLIFDYIMNIYLSHTFIFNSFSRIFVWASSLLTCWSCAWNFKINATVNKKKFIS